MSARPATLRLDRLLANLGYGSRREMQALARNGRITLDGSALEDAQARIALEPGLASRLRVDDATIDPLPGIALMMNKPLGVTCSHKDAGPLVFGLLPERWRRRDPAISTIGRLDKETSGLLLLTDDGALLHRIISPKADIAKQYRAVLDGPLTADAGAVFASGTLMLEGESRPLRPARLDVLEAGVARITITEGRYHQVRRMFAALGAHVVELHREAVGGLALPPDLAPGEISPLSPAEVETIFAPRP